MSTEFRIDDPDFDTFENLEIRPFKTDQNVTVSLSHSRRRPLSRLAGIFVEDYLWPSLGGRRGLLAATPNNQ